MAKSPEQTSILLPPEWAMDELTCFMSDAFKNRLATFHHKRQLFSTLIEINGCFSKVVTDWDNPPGLLPALFLIRAHSSFISACEHSTGGQIAEAYPAIRVCLEYAGYALHIHQASNLAELWLKRHDDENSLKTMKKEFVLTNILKTMQAKTPRAAEIYEALYKKSIDFGAHPNERALSANAKFVKEEDTTKYSQAYLQGDNVYLEDVIRTAIWTGVCVLEVFQEIFAERFVFCGVSERLSILKNNVQKIAV